MAQEAGDRLVKAGSRLVNVIATTECNIFPLYWIEDRKLWHWFIFNPNLCGIEWRKQEGEYGDVYELVYIRKDKDPAKHMQGYFYTFPEEKEVSTKDLYTKHPKLPNYWLHHGRADDIIVFSNGEKLNPVTIEGIVLVSGDLTHLELGTGTDSFSFSITGSSSSQGRASCGSYALPTRPDH